MLALLELIQTNISIYCIVPLIVLTGIYFSISLKFIQFRKIATAFKYTIFSGSKINNNNKSDFSSWGALAAVLGGNLGTGNIAGMAIAIAMSGCCAESAIEYLLSNKNKNNNFIIKLFRYVFVAIIPLRDII